MFRGNNETTYRSYGFTHELSKHHPKFHKEDILIELIKLKSGLTDENSTITTLTNLKENTVEIQCHYKYTNQTDFVNAMQTFLTSCLEGLNLIYELKETTRHYEPEPVFIFAHSNLKKLVAGLEERFPERFNTSILQSNRKPDYVIPFGFTSM